MLKKGIGTMYIVLLIFSVAITFISIVYIFKYSNLIKNYNSKKFEPKPQKIYKILVITNSDIPPEIKEMVDYLRMSGYEVFIDKVNFIDSTYMSSFNLIFCDKPISSDFERDSIKKILLNQNIKFISFRDCRDPLLDDYLGIEYKGSLYLYANNRYKIVLEDNILLPTYSQNLTVNYTSLINLKLSEVDCKVGFTVEKIISNEGTTNICFNPPNILYIPYSFSDFFKERPHFYSLILRKFILFD